MFTLGSGIDLSYGSLYTSLATLPNYELSSSTKFYIAGRDIVRWGGEDDPNEIDLDRYIFVPDIKISLAKVYKAPKSEPHHVSELPNFLDIVPKNWEDFCMAVRNGEFGK